MISDSGAEGSTGATTASCASHSSLTASLLKHCELLGVSSPQEYIEALQDVPSSLVIEGHSRLPQGAWGGDRSNARCRGHDNNPSATFELERDLRQSPLFTGRWRSCVEPGKCSCHRRAAAGSPELPACTLPPPPPASCEPLRVHGRQVQSQCGSGCHIRCASEHCTQASQCVLPVSPLLWPGRCKDGAAVDWHGLLRPRAISMASRGPGAAAVPSSTWYEPVPLVMLVSSQVVSKTHCTAPPGSVRNSLPS